MQTAQKELFPEHEAIHFSPFTICLLAFSKNLLAQALEDG
jgi:hypothetical protein